MSSIWTKSWKNCELGIECLQTAKLMAQKQEYFLRLNEAQDELTKYNQNITSVRERKLG